MYAFVLQDWITLRGTDTTPLVQTERDWLEMGPYQDVVAWIDVREETSSGGNSNKIYLETAPIPDDGLFKPMLSAGTFLNVTTQLQVVQFLMGAADVPIAKWLRWKVVGNPTAGLWDVTFRVLVAANAPGLQLPDASTSMDFLLRPEM